MAPALDAAISDGRTAVVWMGSHSSKGGQTSGTDLPQFGQARQQSGADDRTDTFEFLKSLGFGLQPLGLQQSRDEFLQLLDLSPKDLQQLPPLAQQSWIALLLELHFLNRSSFDQLLASTHQLAEFELGLGGQLVWGRLQLATELLE